MNKKIEQLKKLKDQYISLFNGIKEKITDNDSQEANDLLDSLTDIMFLTNNKDLIIIECFERYQVKEYCDDNIKSNRLDCYIKELNDMNFMNCDDLIDCLETLKDQDGDNE